MVYCCVPHCTSRSGKSKGISFHYFPCDSSLEQKWLKAISRENFKPNSNANSVSQAVCSLHFQDSDYKTGLKKRCLKPHSIPSIFPGYPSYKIPKLVPTRRLPERKNLETSLKKGDVGDSVQPKISFSAPERRADMYEKLMNRLEERRRAREEIAVKGKDSFDGNPPDCAPNSLNFNVPEKTADMCEKKMNMLKERHSVTGGIAVKSRHRYCCVVPNCHSSNKEEKISFHEIPSDNNRRLLWLKAISRQGPSKDSPWIPSQYSVVCQKHFKEDDYVQYDNHYYIENKIRRLKRSAVPSLFLPKPSLDKIEAIYFKNTTSVKMSDQQENGNVDYIKCSVPGCQTKSHRKTEHNIEEENILMFPMPHSDWLFNKWKEPLKGYKIELPRDGHICERHFLEKDIERYDRTKTPDGDIIEIRKRIPALRPDAIPIKFLKPPYSVKRKSPAKELTFQNSVRNLTDKTSLTLNSCDSGNSAIDSEDDFSDDSPVNSTEERISHKKKCLSYSELVKNIQLVKKPSKSWSVVCTDEFTIFASWNNKFIAEKRLVIESSLTVRVFLKDWEIEMTDLVDLTTVDDVSLLLEKVESYSIDSTC